jgi:Fe-S-cluster containining protein
MSNYPENDTDREFSDSKPLLTVPNKGIKIHSEMVGILQKLISLQGVDCLSPSFRELFSLYLANFENYQASILSHNDYSSTCKAGCSCCCNHWVEDVNSFEATIICDYISKNYPERIPEIIKICESDSKTLEHLERTMNAHPDVARTPEEQLDQTDLLLSIFYQFKLPCPLLDQNGMCTIYPVRPITCRIYMSFSDPSQCLPEYINEDDIPTYLLDAQEEVSELLDELHFKHVKFEGNTGLRSLLLSHFTL